MPRLKLKLLGQMECRSPSGELLSLPTRKAEALLAYLALAPGIRHPRDRLVNLLWSDRGEDQARNSLRQSLSSLNKILDEVLPGTLEVERTTTRLKADAVEIDVLEFKRLADQSDIEILAKAADLYQGEFLEGMVIRDPACEQWLAEERDNLKRAYVEVLNSLSRMQLEHLDYGAAIQSAEQLVTTDPLEEWAWRTLMTAYQQKGNRNHALLAYKRCCEVLQKELGVEPELETSELQAEIKAGPAIKPEGKFAVIDAVEESEIPLQVQVAENSILVLPLQNLSNDPDQQYFSDGLTESIVMGLSLFPSLKVHSRNSSFAAGGQSLSISEIGNKFLVQYVVEGSIRKSEDSLRVSAQLIDTRNGEQVWGNRFDNPLEETFELEDRVTRSIVAAIKGKIDIADTEIAIRKPAQDIKSYDLLLQGYYHLQKYTPSDSRKCLEIFHSCLELEPNNSHIHNRLYQSYIVNWLGGWIAPREGIFERAGFHIKKALSLAADDALIQADYAEYCMFREDWNEAEIHADCSFLINPNDPEVLATISAIYAGLGQVDKAIELADTCYALDPFHPWIHWVAGVAFYRGKQYHEALRSFNSMPNAADEIYGWIAACHCRLGDKDNATKYLQLYLDISKSNMDQFPQTLDEWRQYWWASASFKSGDDVDYPFDALCDAGLREFVETDAITVSDELTHNIAVLPFDNLSGDPDQEYFSDGITESIILNLSLFPGLLVKSRNSSFAFKEQLKSLGEISKELNVDYVVEGSIRKARDRIRITVQLIDAQSGNQIWGKRYDSDLSDLFDLEEELSRTIAATVTGRIESDIQCIAMAKSVPHQQSYDLLLAGKYHYYKYTREDIAIARNRLKGCLESEPENVHALVYMFGCNIVDWMERWVEDYKNSFRLAGEYISKALKLDPEIGIVQNYYAIYMIFCRDYQAASYHVEKALAMNPNDPEYLTTKAFNLNAIGEFKSALEVSQKCLRLDPYHPWVEWIIAEALLYTGQLEESIHTNLNSKTTLSYLRALLVVAYSKRGGHIEARQAMQQFLSACRDSMLSMPGSRKEWKIYWSDNLPYRDTQLTEDMIECLMKAGLCEENNDNSDDPPSIAVLPFENMSGDPEQEFFSDGITTDIISTLSKFQHMRIVARHSILQYKTQKASIADIASQQDVRYILEGSVRKSGDRIRVNAELIDSQNEQSCWSERYDRDLDDLFAVQDEITRDIALAMKVQLDDGDMAVHRSAGTANIKAWQLTLEAIDLQDTYIRENILKARVMATEAIKLDPDYPYAWVALAWTHWQETFSGWCESFEESLAEAEKANQQALALVPEYAEAWSQAGMIHLMNHEADKALKACSKAVNLEPGNAEIQALMAITLIFVGDYERAQLHNQNKLKLCPVLPNWYYLDGGQIELRLGNLDAAIDWFQRGIDVEPDSPLCRFYLINAMMELDDDVAAEALANEIRGLDKSASGRGLVRMCSQDKILRDQFQANLERFNLF